MDLDNLEKVYGDKVAWCYFDGEDESETIGVYSRCPECSRFVKRGKVLMNMAGHIKLKGWKCKVHGEVYPYFDRNFSEYNDETSPRSHEGCHRLY